jgi:cell division protein FtsW
MIGVIANAARHEPDAVAALRAGREDRMNRWLRLPLPEPYNPTRVEALRDRLRTPRSAGQPPSRPSRPAQKAAKQPAKKARRAAKRRQPARARQARPAAERRRRDRCIM